MADSTENQLKIEGVRSTDQSYRVAEESSAWTVESALLAESLLKARRVENQLVLDRG